MNSRRFMKISFPILALVGIYFLGPAPEKPVYSTVMPIVPGEATALEKYVADQEAKHKVKPGNEAEIVWNDSTHSKTEYVVVYLHGFTASKMEGDPVHREFAKTFGCNLYLARLADHGIDTTETLLNFTADRLWDSAKDALAIGKQLGNKVILMSTSTGGTLALKLAGDFPQDVFALINMSPNIELNNGASFLLNGPWGLYIARGVFKGKYRTSETTGEESKYWNASHRLEALPQLEELLETTMTEATFKKVTQPSLTLYYYKNENEQDSQVRVSAMLRMNEQLGTPADLKEAIAFPEAGAHVIGSALTSKAVDEVQKAMDTFAVDKLKMVKVAH